MGFLIVLKGLISDSDCDLCMRFPVVLSINHTFCLRVVVSQEKEAGDQLEKLGLRHYFVCPPRHLQKEVIQTMYNIAVIKRYSSTLADQSSK